MQKNIEKSAKCKVFKSTSTLKTNDLEIIRVLYKNKGGLIANTISKLTKIKQRNLYKKLNKLRNKGLIFNVYPMWKLTMNGFKIFQGEYLKGSKELIELHNLSFVIKLFRKPDWWERRTNRLKKYNLQNVSWGNNKYQQATKESAVIQYFSNSIIVMVRKRYYGMDSYSCFLQGVDDFLKIYDKIEKDLNFKFFADGIPQVSIRSQHYVNLNDIVHKNCKKTGSKFEVVIDGKLRMWVDMSDPAGVESGHKDYAPEDMAKYQPYVKDFIINNPPNNTELATISRENIGAIKMVIDHQRTSQEGITGVINKLGEQIESHLALIQEYRKENIAWRKEVGESKKPFLQRILRRKTNNENH